MFNNYASNLKHTIVDDQNTNDQSKTKKRTRMPFTKEEDQQLLQLVQYIGVNDKSNWYFIASHIKGRTPRQCRERYQLFLSDDVRKKAKWTKDEDELLISKYKIYGPHWKQMEQFFNGRTSYNIKNRFISLNRRYKFANKSQSTFNYDSYSPTENKLENKIEKTIEKPIEDDSSLLTQTENNQKEIYSSAFTDFDFDFDDFFPIFDGNENYNLFE